MGHLSQSYKVPVTWEYDREQDLWSSSQTGWTLVKNSTDMHDVLSFQCADLELENICVVLFSRTFSLGTLLHLSEERYLGKEHPFLSIWVRSVARPLPAINPGAVIMLLQFPFFHRSPRHFYNADWGYLYLRKWGHCTYSVVWSRIKTLVCGPLTLLSV